MSFKRTKVVMLPTNEKAKKGDLLLHKEVLMIAPIPLGKNALHLYFLSDDEIKEGDWWIDLLENRIFQVTEEDVIVAKADGLPHNEFKKIIATTDKSLVVSKDTGIVGIEYNLPQPSEGFIQKFVDSYNSSKPITEVNAEYEIDIMKASDPKFDLEPFEKLKVDPKDNTITIKKLKDTWTRDEVVTLILQSNLDSHVAREGEFDIMHWIAENL